MTNIWFEYKYKSFSEIINVASNNEIIDYIIIATIIILSALLIIYIMPKIYKNIEKTKLDKEKKRKKDKLKYLWVQNEIQTEIEKRFAEEDKKEIEEKLNKINNN